MKTNSKEYHQLSHIETILGKFNNTKDVSKNYPDVTNTIPMHQFMSNYFNNHRFLGSRDRRAIRQGVYSYLRLGNILINRNFNERLSIGLFLCSLENSELLNYLSETNLWLKNANPSTPLEEKLGVVKNIFPDFNLFDLCHCLPFISEKINKQEWALSMFNPPHVWIRLRNGFETFVKNELAQALFVFEENPAFPQSLSFPPQTPLQNLESFRKGWFEIQDISSQRIFENIKIPENCHVWDCCCGSGGKSLLLLDKFPTIHLFCSDVRDTMLFNLKERLNKAGHKQICTTNIDLTKPDLPDMLFDFILVDAPCSGSGTWARTPEAMQSCNENALEKFNLLQSTILKNLSSYLKPSGKLIYTTCSVFSVENEKLITQLENEKIYRKISDDYISGVKTTSDTMYRALLERK
ncbi:MAG: hypothetical protein A3H98_01145 [Bacteroidetes bacterium RIFCSPLOWO2_02_FULL_36_8]|nr:MAG: hypothetical protein A3H98_01145 [Bacteroidetes bacterium RIFCSPLOWO2_02_FULL_36_8]